MGRVMKALANGIAAFLVFFERVLKPAGASAEAG